MNRSLLIAFIFAVAATLWVLSGTIGETGPEEQSVASLESESEADSQAESKAPELFKVRVKDIVAESFADELVLQGDIQAVREIEVKAETRGTVERLSAKKGDVLKSGQAILKISTDDREARLKQAQADLKVRQADLKAGVKLREKRLLSENQHEQNQANVIAAEAAVTQIKVELEQTNVSAAFSGILDDLHVELGDYVSQGDPLARLVDNSKVLIAADVPQQHISKVDIGQKVTATLLNGDKLEGTVTYISSSANTQTRTFSIEAESNLDTSRVNTKGNTLRFGQSAQVTLEFGQGLAHKISPSHLDLASSGQLRVKGVTEMGKVVTKDVEILRNESDGLWVSGIPEQFRLITVGQGFVSSGDAVNILVDGEDDATPNSEPSS